MIQFSKMHGLGNDFIVIDAINQAINLSAEQIARLADRHFGIGCDQLLLLEPAHSSKADFRFRIFNADGKEAEQCGNGARCIAKFIHDRGLATKNPIIVETLGGLIQLNIETDGQVTVDMGAPVFEPADIPFEAGAIANSYQLDVEGERFEIGVVSMGNPHAVIQHQALDSIEIDQVGPLIENHPSFPLRVNVGFMQIMARNHIRLRVYERGVGETLACGSGACAAMVVGYKQQVLDKSVTVDLPGGSLLVKWSGNGAPVKITGPASHVYEGNIEL